MNTLGNNNLLIASKTKKLIYLLTNLLEIIPKKHYYIKNKALYYAYDLLENIYAANYNSSIDFDKEKVHIKRDISMLDFIIGLLLDKKYILIKKCNRLLYVLTEVNKMTIVWFSKMERQTSENKLLQS